MRDQADLVVFCHLRWDFVFQRPQHLLSRMAKHRRVFLIEEPLIVESEEAKLDITQVSENLIVARPQFSSGAPGFGEEHMPKLRELTAQLLREHDVTRCISWFYTPLALPLLDQTPHDLVVYDCMDALDAFLHAPPLLKQREQELLAVADLAFTGGPSLFRRLENRHPHAHCFPSSVDAAHFAQAKSPGAEPDDQSRIGRPRLGYFGVIDERIDLQLLDAVAAAHPEWHIVMVGPVVKIDPATLPRRPNLHYLGQKQYSELPGYLRGWDVCILPFARNESTRYISPTKTLEYMAAEKPIVSTPITDVAEPYGHIVYIADGATEFTQACGSALSAATDERERRLGLMRQVLATTSWDSTAQRMEDLMDKRLDEKKSESAIAGRADSQMNTSPVVVVGAGPTGLSAAYHLGEEALLVEKNDQVGGWCRSINLDGFTFDFAGHIMFSNDPYVHDLYQKLLGDNVHWQNREAWIYSKQTYTRYPFQGALYGLPPEVIKECIVGAIEARYGSLKPPTAAASSGSAAANGNGHSSGAANGSVGGGAGGITHSRSMAASSSSGAAHAATHASSSNSITSNGSGNGQSNGNGHVIGNSNGHANGKSQLHSHGNGNDSHGQSIKKLTASAGPSNGSNRLDASVSKPVNRLSSSSSTCAEGDVKDCCADGVMESTARLVEARATNGQAADANSTNSVAPANNAAPANFEEFIYKVWGAGIAKHFAVPYNRKLWAVPLSEMETSWLGGRVPMPDLEEMIEGALQPVGKPMGPNARFGYPLRGGFQALMNGFLPYVQDRLLLNKKVASVSPSAHEITFEDGQVIRYEQLISTMPLPVLIRLMGDEAPREVQAAAAGLRHVSVRCVNIGVGRENLTEKHWIYYPEQTVFHRIFVQGNASPYCNPEGGFGLTCEITYSPHKPLPCDGEELIQRCIDDCRAVGIIQADDPIWTSNQVDMPFAYVVYDHARPKNIATIRQWLETQDVILAGRYSEWEYYNSDHAFIAGKKAAEAVRAQRAKKLAPRFDAAQLDSALTK